MYVNSRRQNINLWNSHTLTMGGSAGSTAWNVLNEGTYSSRPPQWHLCVQQGLTFPLSVHSRKIKWYHGPQSSVRNFIEWRLSGTERKHKRRFQDAFGWRYVTIYPLPRVRKRAPFAVPVTAWECARWPLEDAFTPFLGPFPAVAWLIAPERAE